jgi:hypothetical protein
MLAGFSLPANKSAEQRDDGGLVVGDAAGTRPFVSAYRVTFA